MVMHGAQAGVCEALRSAHSYLPPQRPSSPQKRAGLPFLSGEKKQGPYLTSFSRRAMHTISERDTSPSGLGPVILTALR